MSIPRFTSNLTQKLTNVPQRIYNPVITTGNNIIVKRPQTSNREQIDRGRNGEDIILQTRPQSYDEYLRNSHDERNLIPKSVKPISIDQDEEITIDSNRRLSQAQEWLLNQRQGDNIDNISERDQLSSGLEEAAYNRFPDFARRAEISTDGIDYFESRDYQDSQRAEEEDDKPEPGYRTAQMGSLPNLNIIPQMKSSSNLSVRQRKQKKSSLKKIPQASIPKLTMAQDLIQIGIEPSSKSGAINVIPQVSLSSFPPPSNTGDILISSKISIISPITQKGEFSNKRAQVGMSERVLQMNIPLFIQNNMGPNASWV